MSSVLNALTSPAEQLEALGRAIAPQAAVGTRPRHTSWWLLGDAVLLVVIGPAIYYLRFWGHESPNFGQHAGMLVLYVALFLLAGNADGLYRQDRPRPLAQDAVAVVRTMMAAVLVLLMAVFLVRASGISRLTVCLTALFTTSAMIGLRYVVREMFAPYAARPMIDRQILIVGAGKVGRALALYLERRTEFSYRVRGFLDDHVTGDSVLGTISEFREIARSNFIDEVFITIPSSRTIVKMITREARALRIDVKVVPELYDGIGWLSPLEFLGEFPIRVLHREPLPAGGLVIKRLIDLLISGMALTFISPLLAAIALAIKLDSPGPVFYLGRRVGRKGREFTCYKFRTMVADADRRKAELAHLNERQGALFKVSNDPRITRLGRFLRKYSLDELPQLWNVLKGDMSLVGPRPPVPEEVSEYELEQLRRLDVTPGITGLWQVSARRDPSFETAVMLDTQYIENWSVWLDVAILFKTLRVVVQGTGC
ncbi:MAG: sugar transferase [Terriglobales bacterium]